MFFSMGVGISLCKRRGSVAAKEEECLRVGQEEAKEGAQHKK